MNKSKTIYRTRLTANFTTLPNALLRDSKLSFKARGMLAMILSNSDTWEAHQTWLVSQGTEGREAIRSGMAELEKAGYAVFCVTKDDSGRFVQKIWTFYDSPVFESDRSNVSHWMDDCMEIPPCDGNPPSGFPASGFPASGNPSTKKEHPTENNLQKTITESASDLSEEIYNAYPRKIGRPAAIKAIKAAIRCSPAQHVLERTLAYAAARRGEDAQFTPHPATWFNQHRFNDDPKTWAFSKNKIATVPILAQDAPRLFDLSAAMNE